MENNKTPHEPPKIDEYKLRDVLEATQDELVKLFREHESIELRIRKLQDDVVHLAALCGEKVEDPLEQLGLTDAVRWIFSSQKRALNVYEIVDELQKSYKEVSGYKNLPANIHTIFKRLEKANEIRKVSDPDGILGKIGAVRYMWIGGLGPVPPTQSWLREKLKKS